MAEGMETQWLERLAGVDWRGAAGRGVAIFLLGYVAVPLLAGRGGHGISFVQFSATAASFVLATVTIFRLLRRESPEDQDFATMAPPPAPPAATEPAAAPAKPEALKWTSAMLRELAPTRLEMLVAAYYGAKGIRVDARPQKDWSGVMLRLFHEDGEEITCLVRCKASDGEAVERRQIEELLRVMVDQETPKAFFFAPDGFSEEAGRLARSAHITPVDDKLLLAMLNRLPDEARQRLHTLAHRADQPSVAHSRAE